MVYWIKIAASLASYYVRWLRGALRLAWGFCPFCNSDAPLIDHCPLCANRPRGLLIRGIARRREAWSDFAFLMGVAWPFAEAVRGDDGKV